MEESNFDIMYEKIMAERRAYINLRYSSSKDWFRKHFKKLQDLIDTYKKNRELPSIYGDTALEIISNMAKNDGFVRKDGKPFSSSDVAGYMAEVRREKGLSKRQLAPHPTSVRAAAKLEITGGRVRPGKASASPSSSAEVVSKPVVPEPIQAKITDIEDRYDREMHSGKNSSFNGEDRFFLEKALYPYFIEQKSKYPNNKFWTVAKSLKYSTYKHVNYIDHLREKIMSSGLWDHFKDM
ncbi:hypothetical protein [Burkholderia cenocepacia]|uniref:hypothetical protein n=1 Tax=Burkholderia cenocepacia TaxID=95486 RepID=UPI002236F028|nr:hypothetical protein [Burkholderia cenocepacia]MCW5156319.1 hypothetical protein [Burkholderia cenocepacia]